MICWHRYKYVMVDGYYWVGGVVGGIKISQFVKVKRCKKCGKFKGIRQP